MGPDAVAEDTVAGSDCRGTAAPEDNVGEDETVSSVVAVSGDGDIVDVVDYVPGHALHEKGLQRQIGVGTLVSSQERRALAVPLISRG